MVYAIFCSESLPLGGRVEDPDNRRHRDDDDDDDEDEDDDDDDSDGELQCHSLKSQ